MAYIIRRKDGEEDLEDCPICKGRCHVDCKNCKGEGEFKCEDCGGDGNCRHCGEGFCPECDGIGHFKCPKCEGEGEIECENCDAGTVVIELKEIPYGRGDEYIKYWDYANKHEEKQTELILNT